MNERKILLIGCSWTSGTDYDEVTNCYRPAPAEYLDTDRYKIYNAGVAGSSIQLHNFLLEELLTSIRPDHVFFQITHRRRHCCQTSDTPLKDILKLAWREEKPNYFNFLLEEVIKKHFNIITISNYNSKVKNQTAVQQAHNKYFENIVSTDLLLSEFYSALTYAKNLLKDVSHTFIASNLESSEQPLSEYKSLLGEKVYVPDICIPKYDKYLVDVGHHLNPKGAELYCKKIYEPNLD